MSSNVYNDFGVWALGFGFGLMVSLRFIWV
jgi:hypothetical protein